MHRYEESQRARNIIVRRTTEKVKTLNLPGLFKRGGIRL